MAPWRQRRRATGARRGEIVPFGLAQSGVDGRRVEPAALSPGVVARGVWFDDDYTLFLSAHIAYGCHAEVARHILSEHAPPLLDASWDALVCTVETCPEARRWLGRPSLDKAASGCG
jgi:hypothetical protein